MIRHDNPPVVRVDFDGIGDLCRFVESGPSLYHDYAESTNGRSRDWNGNVTLAGAVDLARHGCPDLRREWSDAYKADFPQVGTTAPCYDYDVGGMYPDIGRAVAGDPACMVVPGAASEYKPIIGIWISKFLSARIAADNLRNQGLAVLAYIDAAEAAGYRMEISAVMRAKGSAGTILDARWPIKRPDEAVDLDKLAFALAHPAVTRRLILAVEERIEGIRDIVSNSYGSPANAPDLPPRVVYFAQPAEDCWRTPAGAMQAVGKALQENACYVRDDPLYRA